jgi:sugar lactone lactonase YvrE
MSPTPTSTPAVRKLHPAFLFILLLVIALSGCATEFKCSTKPAFFPPPPDSPRIQWLTGIFNSKDIGAKDSQSSFALVVTGKEKAATIRKIGKSYGVAVHKGKIYVAETNESRVAVIDPVHQTFEYLKGLANPKGGLIAPVNLCFDNDDNLYVVDTGRREIVVYDKNEEYVTALGRDVPKFLRAPKFVSVAYFNGKLYVLDNQNSRIRVLDPKTGEQTGDIGYIEKKNQSLRFPANMAIDSAGKILVTDIGSNRVMAYDIDGNFLSGFGQNTDQFGNFVKPKGISVDEQGRIYVVDGGTNMVQVFDDQYRLLTYFGWPGLETGSLSAPTGIAVTTELVDYYQKFAAPGFKLEKLIFVVNQFGTEYCVPPVSIYGLGEMKK